MLPNDEKRRGHPVTATGGRVASDRSFAAAHEGEGELLKQLTKMVLETARTGRRILLRINAS